MDFICFACKRVRFYRFQCYEDSSIRIRRLIIALIHFFLEKTDNQKIKYILYTF